MSTTEATARTQHLFLTRGVVAIAWAAVFAAVSDSPTADVTVGAGALIVLYPLIDAAASRRRAEPTDSLGGCCIPACSRGAAAARPTRPPGF